MVEVIGSIPIHKILLPCGVMAARMVLVHEMQVRLLLGQPKDGYSKCNKLKLLI